MAGLTLAQARSQWWKQQGLGVAPGKRKPSVASVLGASGWLRTLGGADVYIAARARCPGMKRADLDAVIASGELRVVPAARGCIYAVPAAVVGDLMALNEAPWRKQTEKDLAKVGSTMKVVETLAKAVLAALTAPMTTDVLRKALPAGSIPSFGEAGKKVGLSSPLPLALRHLEFTGKIERTLEGGRLDTERYQWRKAEWKTPAAQPTAAAQLATVVGAFLDFAGPVTLAQISAWTGRAQRDLAPIVEELADPVEVEGLGPAWTRVSSAVPGKLAEPSGLALLAFEDNYLVTHGGPAVVTDPRHHGITIDIWGGPGKPQPIGKASHITGRTIVKDGLVIGFWEVDPKAHGAVWHTFEPAPAALAREIDELAQSVATFMLDDIGHARSFSLDTDALVQERADKVKKLRPAKKK
jgi:hypothetical protein